jgi:hypothetical protein
VQLGQLETGFLEDCYEDRRALWEVPLYAPTRSVDEAIAFVTPLVADGYLTTLEVRRGTRHGRQCRWHSMTLFYVVRERANYQPSSGGQVFYLLSITAKGEGPISRDAVPGD